MSLNRKKLHQARVQGTDDNFGKRYQIMTIYTLE